MNFRTFLGWTGAIAFTAYYLWSWWTGTGLHAFLTVKMAEIFGSADDRLLLFVPLIFGNVVILWLGGIKGGPADAPKLTPLQQADLNVRVSSRVIFAGAVVVAGGVGAYFYAQGLPDGTEDPIAMSIASLPDPIPVGQKVILKGERPDGFGAIIVEEGRGSTKETFYVPVVPFGVDPRTVEVAFFHVVTLQGENNNPNFRMFEEPGYLRRTTLEPLARNLMEEQGVAVASSVYFVQSSGQGPKGDWTVGSFIAMGVGGLLFIIGLINTLLAMARRRKVRRAEL
ncbi:hypothetical protein [Jannaschia pohangensis]|uniref:Uncharacterized protein n=1 Tax=Jannaschia pohangensis TaxID=390807 RepID=A0A1I3GFT9_9RHOB|nr:hypothetical protein [Jannaschia pohangensis]SFI22356.1 hypothetical protein SAMN04488095_0181 [Jannaschia pohangensis]